MYKTEGNLEIINRFQYLNLEYEYNTHKIKSVTGYTNIALARNRNEMTKKKK